MKPKIVVEKTTLAKDVVVATQILNNAISKAELAGLKLQYSGGYVKDSYRPIVHVEVYEQEDKVVFAQTPKEK